MCLLPQQRKTISANYDVKISYREWVDGECFYRRFVLALPRYSTHLFPLKYGRSGVFSVGTLLATHTVEI